MPAQLGESVRFLFEWSVLGVPTGSLSPTPTVTILSPAGAVLVNGASLTALASTAFYYYDYALPGSGAGNYVAQGFCSQANLDIQYLQPISLAVGQAWIQDLDATISSRSTYAGGAVASVTGNVGGNVVGSVGSLSAQAQTDVESALTAQGYTTTRAVKLDNADVATSTRLATSGYIAPDNTDIAAIKIKTDNLPASPASTGDVTMVGAAVAALNNISQAQVKTQVVNALSVDTYVEPSTVPAATASLAAKIGWIMTVLRNKLTQTASTQTLLADNGTTPIATSATSDDGTVFTRAKWQ